MHVEISNDMIDINIDYHKAANYSLINNRIPVCQTLTLTNRTEAPIGDLEVVCEGEYLMPSVQQVPQLKAGETIRLDAIGIVPDADKWLELTESVVTSFSIKVQTGDGQTIEQQFPLELMAYDQWLGTSILPQTLASFVTPNHPDINALVVKAAEVLKSVCGSAQFGEYQSGSTNQVRQQVAAVYKAIHLCGIVYRAMPASFTEVGQRVTMPHQVLASKLGNCLELTLLFASVLESIGIHSVVVIEEGHAYLGVWLVDDSCAYSVCDDVSFLEKKCSRGIDEMLVLETTMVTQEKTSFEQAVTAAERRLADHGKFEMFVDLFRCRLEHFLPLPTRVRESGKWRVESGMWSVESGEWNAESGKWRVESGKWNVESGEWKAHDRFDLSNIADTKKELTKLDIWERKLLDFSLRNSLLNLYLRRKAIQFISFDVDRIEDHLADEEEYCILPKPNIEFRVDPEERLVRSKQYTSLQMLISNDVEHHRLHTYQTEAETQATLKNIYRASRSAIEETGANALFLTIGTLRWYETDKSETPHFAPILLLPVEMVYRRGEYFVRARDEETILNITLIEFLRQNYDIQVKGLDPLPKDEHGVDVPLVFAILRDALKNQKRWDVEEECLLGNFSFSKFLMWNDVHSHREELMQNTVVSSLVENHLTWKPEPVRQDLKEVDAELSPMEVALPVSADSSQMAAVLEAGAGHSFILYGPPGTGKSQTITNLIANALFQGKRVLFVAEKMAALSVVQNRLAKIGLDPFCLELHSNKVAKKHVLGQLAKALDVSHIVPPAAYQDRADKLFALRKEMIAYLKALHEADASDGLSLYDCIVRYEHYDCQPLATFHQTPALDAELAKHGEKDIEQLMTQLDTMFQLVGQPSENALNGLLLEAEGLNPDQVQARLQEARQLITECEAERDELEAIKKVKEVLLRDNTPELLKADIVSLYDEWRSVKAKWFLPRFFAKKSFLKKLKPYNQYITEGDVDTLFSNLLQYHSKHDVIEKVRGMMKEYFRVEVRPDQLPSQTELADAAQKLERWIDHKEGMRDWIHWCNYTRELHKVGLDSIVAALEQECHEPAELHDSFFKALYKSKAEQKMASRPSLATFEGMIFDEKVKTYIHLTEEFQMLTQKELYARLASKIPHVSENIDSSSEIGLLKRNISNGGRGKSIRDLLDQIPTLLPRLCPCMLMSPMSVAQYLDLAQEKFDLVVFDEASQMPTSEAVGAIARGNALVVVGDPKQMPPTSFFSSTNVDEEEAAIDDMESILEDCRTLEIPSLQLNWHYRSRHESLIAFSNQEYYDGSLITFPSVDDQRTKVSCVHVDGFYDKGGKRSNKAEAEAIVEEVVRRLRDEALRKQSIGVIAFSVVQQALIEDILQERLDADRQLHDLAAEMYEPIFVKNLENVQGDERDVILFSIGYGPNQEGKVSMNFGPLNNVGGERRLNVAVSRARCEMIVYSTLRSSQIDLRRSNARGVEGLKHFLEYAETQTLVKASASGAQRQDTVVAAQIAEALACEGYVTNVNVGRSLFKVDIAISKKESPEVYLLGILLDGEGYRDTQTTRDREIVQPSVLRSLNWKVMRVWSVDWFNNPERVLARILEQLRGKQKEKAQPAPLKSAVFDISKEKVAQVPSFAREYEVYSNKRRKHFDDDAVISDIVKVEQPITLSLLTRKICTLRNQPRVVPSLLDAVSQYVQEHHFVQPDRDGMVVWADEAASQDYPWYRIGDDRDIQDIPMIEVKNAVREAISEQFAISADSLTLIAAKKLGFTRRGPKVEAAIHLALSMLKDDCVISEESGRLKMN